MSARETLEGSPLFPMPIAPFPEKQRLGVTEDGTVDFYGHCAWWCSVAQDFILPNGRSGNSIEDHSGDPFCIGQVGSSQDGLGVHGNTTYVGVELITAYTHGVYKAGDHGLSSKVAITLSSSNDHCDEGMVFLKPSQARSFAASLLRAADHLEGLSPKSLA